MGKRSTNLLPRSVLKRKRLTLRESIWVYLPAYTGLLSVVFLAAGFAMSKLDGTLFAAATIAACVLSLVLFVVSCGYAFMLIDAPGGPGRRREYMINDRPRRLREHKSQPQWKELKNRHPQYGVEVKRADSGMVFTVIRFDPPSGSALDRRIGPWHQEKQQWSASSGRWAVAGHSLRVTDPKTHLLVEAYCEAAEAAKELEKQATEQAAKTLALDGIALAFTPLSDKTTNAEQLEIIREKVQVRRLLDSGDEIPVQSEKRDRRDGLSGNAGGWGF